MLIAARNIHSFYIKRTNDYRIVKIMGKDARSFLQRILSNDVLALESGQGTYAALLEKSSHLVTTLEVFILKDDIYLRLPKLYAEDAIALFEQYIVMDDVEIERLDGALYGLFPDVKDDLFQFKTHQMIKEGSFLGENAIWMRDDLCGLDGLLLSFDSCDCDALESEFKRLGFLEESLELLEYARIHAGLPAAGAELTPDRLILEAGQLGRIDFKKGCYIGQEPICRIHHRGEVKRKIVGWKGIDGYIPTQDDVFDAEEKEGVLTVTSSVESIAKNTQIGLAYCATRYAKSGQRLKNKQGAIELMDLPYDQTLILNDAIRPRYHFKGE